MKNVQAASTRKIIYVGMYSAWPVLWADSGQSTQSLQIVILKNVANGHKIMMHGYLNDDDVGSDFRVQSKNGLALTTV